MSKRYHSPLFYVGNFLFVFFNPRYWTAVRKRDKDWDIALNKAMDKGVEPTKVGEHTCEIEGVQVWIANFPYAYAHPYEPLGRYKKSEERIPYALTRHRFKRYIDDYKKREGKRRAPKLDYTQRNTQALNEKLGD